MNDILTKDLNKTLINEEINNSHVRVINHTGEQLGIMSSDEALIIAYNEGLDLVMISSQSDPPVCKIMDYGKYRFECEKRAKEAKKKQVVIEIKEIQLSPRIETHDLEIKASQACKFLKNGNKVRITLRFRGREMNYISFGNELIERFIQMCSEYCVVEKKPLLESRNLIVTLLPINKK